MVRILKSHGKDSYYLLLHKIATFFFIFQNHSSSVWSCHCLPGFEGEGCSVEMETNCSDKVDNDGGKKKYMNSRATLWEFDCTTKKLHFFYFLIKNLLASFRLKQIF